MRGYVMDNRNDPFIIFTTQEFLSRDISWVISNKIFSNSDHSGFFTSV